MCTCTNEHLFCNLHCVVVVVYSNSYTLMWKFSITVTVFTTISKNQLLLALVGVGEVY